MSTIHHTKPDKTPVNITFNSQVDAVILTNLGLLLFRLAAQLTTDPAATSFQVLAV